MNLLDLLTYTTLDGKRKLRRYVVFALGILICIALIFAYGQWTQAQAMADIQATAIPVQVTIVPTLTVPPTLVPPTDTVETCPSDTSQWELVDVRANDNMKKISPSCVYDELGRTVAWALMSYQGYTEMEINQALKFDHSPLAYPGSLNVMTNTKGPVNVALYGRPSNPAFSEWFVSADGQPAVVFSLRGCFRTQTVVGNDVQSWGSDYPVICELGEDRINAYGFMSLAGDSYTDGTSGSGRQFSLFGYDGKGWVWLGEKSDLYIKTKPESVLKEIQFYSTPYGAPIWDSKWLADNYGVAPKTLPENWLSFTDVKARDRIGQGLNTVQGEATP